MQLHGCLYAATGSSSPGKSGAGVGGGSCCGRMWGRKHMWAVCWPSLRLCALWACRLTAEPQGCRSEDTLEFACLIDPEPGSLELNSFAAVLSHTKFSRPATFKIGLSYALGGG